MVEADLDPESGVLCHMPVWTCTGASGECGCPPGTLCRMEVIVGQSTIACTLNLYMGMPSDSEIRH